MIADINQPAKEWLSDLIKNMGTLLDNGDDPSMLIDIQGVVFEFRLNALPGVFKRVEFEMMRKPKETGECVSAN